MLDIRNRVVELRTVKARTLRKNPKNNSVHSAAQRETMRGVLQDVGYVAALVARELPDGTLELVDGELRSDETPDAEVPVVIVDLNDAEVDTVLATFNPLAQMVQRDQDKTKALLERVDSSNAHVRALLDAQRPKEGPPPDPSEVPSEQPQHDVPGMALEPHEHYDYLVVLCTTTQEWNLLCDRLKIVPTERRGRMGTSRAIRADRLLAALTEAGAK
jgi:hypothetical protein